MVRLLIGLSTKEADALARWAISELRDPRDQIRFLLRRELERRGLLPISDAHRVHDATEGEGESDG